METGDPTRRERQRAATTDEIKATARALMAEHGTAGLSLRAIARQMGLTAPALYRYYANLDDLITALILDAFTALADHLEAVATEHAGQPFEARILALMLAYREWALAHPVDFQLIYGNPIPGYSAPGDLTIPASARTLFAFASALADGIRAGELVPAPEYADVPPEVAARLNGFAEAYGHDLPVAAGYLTLVGWPVMHGVVMLELFEHIGPVVGDVEAYYRRQLRHLLRAINARTG